MAALGAAARGRNVCNILCMTVLGLGVAHVATAGPVVREATGTSIASIQGVVDQFRADLGNPNNGNAAGTQPTGRREINWDGGGAASPAAIIPSPMNTFSNRGAVFVTSGTGFEISGAPSAEFGELNPTYPNIFAAFSAPRLFAALDTNVMDVLFFVPGNTAIAAGVTGFGAVFTDVDTPTSTKMEFYAPDGTLLFERNVLRTAGSESQSFLGVTFNAGEIVGRVRIVSGNASLGPDESATRDLVVMDDFFYSEPVPTQGLTITPDSGRLFRTGAFDMVVGVQGAPGAVANGKVSLDGLDVTASFLACLRPGTVTGGGQTFRCALPRGFLTPGDHTMQVELGFGNGTKLRNAVRWTILGNTEP